MPKNYNKYMVYKDRTRFAHPTADQMMNWLTANGIEFREHSVQIRACNPDGDDAYCMEIHKTNAVVHDFRPHHQQYDGPFLKFVQNYKNFATYDEAINDVCGKNVKYISKNEKSEEEVIENEIELPSGAKPLRDGDKSKLWLVNMNYLVNERGLDKEEVYRANIHYVGTTIVVPYYQYGSIVFYQSRRQLDKVFEFPKATVKKAGDFLFGFDNVEPCGELILFESIFNAMSVGDDAVATGGASLKDGQIALIRALNPSIITFAYDNDGAGIKAIEKDFLALNKIKKGDFIREMHYCLPPLAKDSDDQEDFNDMKKRGVDVRAYINEKRRKMSMRTIFEGVNHKFT